MYIFPLVVAWHILKRIGRGFMVVVRLFDDRELLRTLPWAALKLRVRNDRWMQLQLVGFVAIVIGWPLGVGLLQVTAAGGVVLSIAFGLWFAALVAQPLRWWRK